MKVLIVEDDEFKQRRIAQVVREDYPEAEVHLERSVNSGLKGISEFHPDLILLDMSLTTFDVGPGEPGGRPQNFGGIEVLRQMERLNFTIPVIVITQHERFADRGEEVHLSAVHKELREEHAEVFKGLIYYNSAAGSWKKQLRIRINDIINRGDQSGRKNSRRRR